jgi:predicted DCC family thiol-disulfide oxidoreductase YuxK
MHSTYSTITNHPQPLVLFDGQCNLCNKSVQFILKNEKNAVIYFTQIKSELGQAILRIYKYPEDYNSSVLFLENDVIYSESEAVLKICAFLKSPFRWFVIFRITPSFLRNVLYRFIAKRRLTWFGSTDTCWVMQKKWSHRFLTK